MTTKASKAKTVATKTVATKKRTPVKKAPRKHFAIGLPVRVRSGAKPVGWDDGMGQKFIPDYWDKEDYLRTFQIQAVSDDGASFEVMGWYWSPEDLEIPYA